MSKTLNQAKVHWEVLLAKHAGNAFRDCLNVEDSRNLVAAIIINYSILCERYDSYGHNLIDLMHTECEYLFTLSSVRDLFVLLKDFKDQFLQIDDYADTSQFLRSFKHCIERDDLKRVFAPLKFVFRLNQGEKTPETVSFVLQFCDGFSRIKAKSFDYTENMLEDYFEIEDFLSKHELPCKLVEELNQMILAYNDEFALPEISYRDFHHGPGASASLGRVNPYKKHDTLTSDFLMDYSFPGVFPLSNRPLERTSELLFVPKTFLKWRSISMEPASLMYSQQAVKESMYQWFRNHPYLRRHIHLEDAGYNRKAALEGSFDHNLATIDLSSASDLVSWKLVKEIFRGTKYLRYLYSTRSTATKLPNGRVLPLKKFAPMGSAVCFPVETLLYCACVDLAFSRQGIRRKKRNFLVYGDDIICPTVVYEGVCDILESLGFRINHTKTFHSSYNSFRESCGGEYFHGIDVTPLRLPRNFSWCKLGTVNHHPALYMQYISLCNRLFMHGCRITRSMILRQFVCLPTRLKPLFKRPESQCSQSIWCDDPSNYHLEKRGNSYWQCSEILHGSVTSTRRNIERDLLHFVLEEALRVTGQRVFDSLNFLDEAETVSQAWPEGTRIGTRAHIDS